MRHCRSIDSEYNRSLIGNFYNAIFEDIQDRLPVLGVFSIQRGKSFSVCGHQLAEMHRTEGASFFKSGNYGFMEDNYIGSSVQKNQPMEKWIDFYRECRLLPQISMAERYLDVSVRKKVEYLLEHLDSYLREPEFPSLLHGDLWGGNMLTGPDGKAWIIDPAVYVGDFEADLAMTQLFGSLPKRFYDAYSEINSIDKHGYFERKKLYDLYHLLNHLNLFGEMYLRSVVEIIEEYGG